MFQWITRHQRILNVALVALSFISVAYLPGLRTFGASVWFALLRLVAPVARYILAGVDRDLDP